jgi:hypothetical protein
MKRVLFLFWVLGSFLLNCSSFAQDSMELEDTSTVGSTSQELSQDENIIIKGKVFFDAYEKGDIYIFVKPSFDSIGGMLGNTKISRPGNYAVTIPKEYLEDEGIKSVFIGGHVDIYNEGPNFPRKAGVPFIRLTGGRKELNVDLSQSVIDNVDLEFFRFSEENERSKGVPSW